MRVTEAGRSAPEVAGVARRVRGTGTPAVQAGPSSTDDAEPGEEIA